MRRDVVVAAGRVGRDHELTRDLLQARPARAGCAASRPRRPCRRGRRSTSRTTSPSCASMLHVSTVDVGVRAERAGDDVRCGCRAASSGVSAPRRTSSPTSEWSSETCCSTPSAPAGRRASRRRGRTRSPVVHQRGRDRRAHAGGVRVVARAVVDAAVRLARWSVRQRLLGSPSPAASPCASAPRWRAPRRPRRRWPRPCRRRRRTGARRPGASPRWSAAPARRPWPRRSRRRCRLIRRHPRTGRPSRCRRRRRSSPARSRRSAASRCPFTNVPLVDPRSSR